MNLWESHVDRHLDPKIYHQLRKQTPAKEYTPTSEGMSEELSQTDQANAMSFSGVIEDKTP